MRGFVPEDVYEATIGRVIGAVQGNEGSYPVRLVIALLVLVVGWYASKVVVRLAGRTIARRIERPSVTRSVLRTIRFSVLLFTAIVVAGILGVGDVEILLSVGVISAVVAVVLAPLIGSLINGLFILTDQPYEIGDMIEVADAGHVGFVEDITIRYTKVFTLENTFLVIPNSEIHDRDVINYSAEDERTRIDVEFVITYGSDLETAITAAKRAARSVETVISGGPAVRIGSARYDAAPRCDVREFADDGIRLVVRFWVSRPYKMTKDRSAVLRAIRTRYEDEPVEFAYPHRHLVFDDPGTGSDGLDPAPDEFADERPRE
ncbi:mechanosensitive ion channel family protein [Halovivax limisalsi]|uniref:mechanosensitive ion channel family protein n=1 Tax=Halovivax limisalsi TaxID=1453760 RepID=UPI001FFDEB1D|nr:mechanosensitive ion channel family protein [Halovivax limisalsi]